MSGYAQRPTKISARLRNPLHTSTPLSARLRNAPSYLRLPMRPAEKQAAFTQNLLHWHAHDNRRELPWKGARDPYKIWLSEIILQQTRAEQGRPYYERFLAHYPTVGELAAAPDDEVFRLWQGLGYYNRCRNLLATARYVSHELGGNFPGTHEGLLALKGVGAYTAAAIASFAFDLPQAVVDGNVYRVLARVFKIELPFDSTEGKKAFKALADNLLEPAAGAAYNQAIMDLGATICTPKLPRCTECPQQDICAAYREGLINFLPARSKKTAVRERWLHYLIIHFEESIWLRKRAESDVWQGLYEPLLVETGAALDSRALAAHAAFTRLQAGAMPEFEGSLKQKLTHQLLHIRFFSLRLTEKPEGLPEDGIWVPPASLAAYSFPRSLVLFFEKRKYF